MFDQKKLDAYLKEMKDKNGIQQPILQCCKKDIKKIFQKVQPKIKDFEKQKTLGEVKKWYDQNSTKMRGMKDYQMGKSDDFMIDIITIIILAVYLSFQKKTPRLTQLICLWLNFHSTKNVLEVKTGQGKTMIVAMTALYYAMRGKKVDVFTSSSALATTQTKSDSPVRALFKIFDVTLADNCNISKLSQAQAARVYENQVIYGTSFEFQADYLKKIFTGDVRYFKNRQFDSNHVAILDQVDALLIDRMRDSTRLSSPKPLFQCIVALFVLIYEIKTQIIKAKSQFGGTMKITILGIELKLKQQIKINENISKQDYNTFIQQEKDQILLIIKQALQKTTLKTLFPSYLLASNGYIMSQLTNWIHNCYQASKYQQNVSYIVRNGAVIPIDLSSGTYQANTKWSDGIHQFIELQHKISPSVDSLVTNYQSNIIYFKRYKNYLHGMTGTIARSIVKDNKESKFEQFLRKDYKLSIYKIPTFEKRLLKIEYPKMLLENEWMHNIYKEAIEISKKRMVLVIFQTIKQATQFLGLFKLNSTSNIIELYDHDTYEDTRNIKLDKFNTIIISTNLGGRGTDYVIENKQILQNGGLFVMMTYFAQNWRIQEQAFGRAARNGQKGSGAFYINMNQLMPYQNDSIHQNQQASTQRFNQLEAARCKDQITQFQKATIATKNEQKKGILLDKFRQRYLTSNLKRLNYLQDKINSQQRIINQCRNELIQSCELKMQNNLVQQQWGLFLKKNIGQSGQNQKQITINFDDFVNIYNQNFKNDNINPGILTAAGSQMIRYQQSKKPKANKLIDRASRKNLNWVNKYYTLFFHLNNNIHTKIISQSQARYVMKQLKDIAELMLADLAVQIAILQNSNQGSNNQSNLKKLEQGYMEEITNLCTISKTFDQYVLDEGKKIIVTVKSEQSKHGIQILKLKGFTQNFRLRYEEYQQPKQKGFWETVWDVVCIIVVAAVTILACAVLPVLSPLIFAVGCFVIGKIIDGMFSRSSQHSVPQIADTNKERPKFVQITGSTNISQEAKLSVEAFRKKMKQKVGIVKLHYQSLLKQVDKLKTMKVQNTQSRKKVDLIAFTNCKLSQNATNQQINKLYVQNKVEINNNSQYIIRSVAKKNNIGEKIQKANKDIVQQINKNINNVQQKINKGFETIQNQLSKSFQDKVDNIQKENPKTNQQIKIYNEKISSLNLQNKQINKKIESLGQIRQNIMKQVKSTIDKTSTTTFQAKSILKKTNLQNIQLKKVQEIITPIQKPLSDIKKGFEKIQQIKQNWNDSKISVIIDNCNNFKGQQFKEIVSTMRDQYYDTVKQQINKKCDQDQNQIIKQGQQQQKKLQINLLNKVNTQIRDTKNTPFQNQNQINKFMYYQNIVKNNCKASQIDSQTIQSYDHFEQICKQWTKDKIYLMEDVMILQTQKGIFSKIYAKNKQTQNFALAIANNLNIKHVQEDLDKTTHTGKAIISDLIKYLTYKEKKTNDQQQFSQQQQQAQKQQVEKQTDQKIEQNQNLHPFRQKSQILNKQNSVKEYAKAMLYHSTQELMYESDYEKIKQKRQKQFNTALPLSFLPFQYKSQSNQFKKFEQILLRKVCSDAYKKIGDQHLRFLFQSQLTLMKQNQLKTIKLKYPNYKKGQKIKKKLKCESKNNKTTQNLQTSTQQSKQIIVVENQQAQQIVIDKNTKVQVAVKTNKSQIK